MIRKFVYSDVFLRYWELMGLNGGALRRLELQLLQNPKVGAVVEGTGGARKMRFLLVGRGKSAGARVICLDVPKRGTLYLLLAYPKSIQSDLTVEQTKNIRQAIRRIREEEGN